MSSSKKTMTDLETQAHSPPKRSKKILADNSSANEILNLNDVQVKHISLTQKQLLSRDLIKEIIYRGKAKTIRHEIGKIDKQTSLYAKPQAHASSEFNFDNIPIKNNIYSSLGSAKITQIREGLRSQVATLSLKNQSNRYSLKSDSKLQKQQANVRNQRVTVSGLVTYKFSSVNAERSLASEKINREQKLREDIRKANQVRDYHRNRVKKVLLKHSSKRYEDEARKQTNIIQNLDMSTDQFLQKIDQDNQKQMLVYGEKAKKLWFIKQYMVLEDSDYSEGRHIVDQIEKCKTQKHKNQQVKRIKTQDSEERAFERRRVPKLNKNIKVRHLTFVE